MAKHPSKRILPAKYLWFLAIFLLLSGCAQADQGEVSPSTPGKAGGGETERVDSISRTTPVSPILDLTQNSLPANPETTVTAPVVTPAAPVVDRPAVQLAQTISARATGTEASLKALDGIQSTASAAASTLIPGPTALLSPTPTPVSLLARYFAPLASFDGVLPGLLNDLKVSPDGTIWVSNENGIASLQGSTWRMHFSDVILLLAGFDGAGRTWLINEQGTAALSWDGIEWRIYGDGAGWLPVRWTRLLSLEDMVIDQEGRVWMTVFQDVRSFDGREWTVHNLRDIGFIHSEETADYDGFFFPAIEQDLQGNIWIGNCDTRGEELAGQGARWFDGTTWMGNSEPTSAGCVRDIAVDSQGRVWLGIDDLLWRYDPAAKNWTWFELPEPPADTRIGWIEEIRIGPSGNPWLAVALCGGASCGSSYLRYQLQQDKWVNVPQPHEYDPGRLFIDPGGNAWLYSEKQLFRIQGETLEQVLGADICCITQDSRGWLYLGAKQDKLKLIFVERSER